MMCNTHFLTAHHTAVHAESEICVGEVNYFLCACGHFLCEVCCVYLTPYTTVWCVGDIYLILTCCITILCRQNMMT